MYVSIYTCVYVNMLLLSAFKFYTTNMTVLDLFIIINIYDAYIPVSRLISLYI